VLRGISIPTLFVTGSEDTTYAPFLSDALAPLMPNARVEQVPDSGHSVYFQRATASRAHSQDVDASAVGVHERVRTNIKCMTFAHL